MADLKPAITLERAEAVLRSELGRAVRDLRLLKGGQLSQAFAITEFVPGGHLHTRPPGEYLRLLPQALDTLDALHRIDPGDAVGFGYWHEPGRGQFPTWRRYLAAVIEENLARVES